MKRNTIACLVSAVFFALSSSLAVVALNRTRAIDAEAAGLRRKQEVLDADLSKVRRELAADCEEEDRQRAGLAKAEAQAAKAKSAPVAFQPNPQREFVVKHPALIEIYLKSFRANLSQRLRPFYRKAGLSPDAIARFETLISRHEETRVDTMATAAAQGLDDTDPAVAALHRQEADAVQAGQKEVLGEEGYKQLHEFYREQGAEPLVDMAGAYVVDTAPMSGEQAGQLLEILANASNSYRKGGNFNSQTMDWDTALAQSSAILAPEQLDAVKIQAEFSSLGKMSTKYFSRK